jgi:hypothetical protein
MRRIPFSIVPQARPLGIVVELLAVVAKPQALATLGG